MDDTPEDVKCGICMQILRDPRRLPCGHAFCLRPCLLKTPMSEEAGCPYCFIEISAKDLESDDELSEKARLCLMEELNRSFSRCFRTSIRTKRSGSRRRPSFQVPCGSQTPPLPRQSQWMTPIPEVSNQQTYFYPPHNRNYLRITPSTDGPTTTSNQPFHPLQVMPPHPVDTQMSGSWQSADDTSLGKFQALNIPVHYASPHMPYNMCPNCSVPCVSVSRCHHCDKETCHVCQNQHFQMVADSTILRIHKLVSKIPHMRSDCEHKVQVNDIDGAAKRALLADINTVGEALEMSCGIAYANADGTIDKSFKENCADMEKAASYIEGARRSLGSAPIEAFLMEEEETPLVEMLVRRDDLKKTIRRNERVDEIIARMRSSSVSRYKVSQAAVSLTAEVVGNFDFLINENGSKFDLPKKPAATSSSASVRTEPPKIPTEKFDFSKTSDEPIFL